MVNNFKNINFMGIIKNNLSSLILNCPDDTNLSNGTPIYKC